MRVVIDGHVHLSNPEFVPELLKIAHNLAFDKMALVAIAARDNVNDNPIIYGVKSRYPELFYAFAGLDHSARYLGKGVAIPDYGEQVKIAIALGADGMKLLETKPDRRKEIDIPIDSPAYAPMFDAMEENKFPVIWHVADPEEFWDSETTPGWAKENNWGYNETFTPYKQFYREVENVLKRHPKLRAAFAHFYFLSGNLEQAGDFLDRYENVHFDLAPGIEMLYNTSKNPNASRDFFIKYRKRIIFGTDIGDFLSVEESEHRARMVFRWLESDDEFQVPEGADFLLGPPEDGIIRGMSLPVDVLQDIYVNNFKRFAGDKPKILDQSLVNNECKRIAELVKLLNRSE